MKIDIRFRGLPSSKLLRDHALRRLRTRLRRFAEELSEVQVRIEDVNGPRGGLDKRCHVTVRGPSVPTTSLVQQGEDAYAATTRAIERVAHAIARSLHRGHTRKRGALPLRELAPTPA